MSAPTVENPQPSVLSGRKIPMRRLVRVELRKSYNTLSGRWLLISIVAITAIALVLFFINADTENRQFGNFMGFTSMPQGILIPVLGILLVTSEWSQRTALVTFTLSPNRLKVLTAKVVAAVVLGMAAVVVSNLLAAGLAAVGGASDPWNGTLSENLDVGLVQFGTFQLINIMWGLAFGLMLQNSPFAIVGFFAVPTVISIVSQIWSAMDDIGPWVDLSTSMQVLFMKSDLTADETNHIIVGTLIWVVLPFVAGVIRLLRSEVK